jgi:hypothetical protein
MKLKTFAITVLGLVFFLMIGLPCSSILAAENLPPGSILPDFKIGGPNSPQTKAYLGVPDEKSFSLAQIKSKLTLVEFFDVF